MWTVAIFFLAVTVSCGSSVEPDITELLNTDSTKWSEWVKNTGKYDGWRSQNLPPNGQLVYGLCAISSEFRENWIRSPFIRREEAISINIEISFTMKSCQVAPGRGKNCEETFRLMMYEADGAGDVPSSWSDRIYTTVSVVSPNVKWTDSRLDENIVNKKTFKVESKRKGIFIALKDTGACVMVERIRVFYVACPSTTLLFADYPKVVVSHGYQIKNVNGKCVPGADIIDNRKVPQMLCQPNGKWHLLDTAFCRCNGGFTSLMDKRGCIECPANTFKLSPGSDKCQYCPKYSYSDRGSTKCLCNPGFHPIISDSRGFRCAQQPSKPRNLFSNTIDTGQTNLSWSEPAVTGEGHGNEGQHNLHYKVKCLSCLEYDVPVFLPKDETKDTSVIIEGLDSGKIYKFSVTAFNFVTQYFNLSNPVGSTEEISITTKHSDPKYAIDHVMVRRTNTKDKLLVTWIKTPNGSPQSYQVVLLEISSELSIQKSPKSKSVRSIILNTKQTHCNFKYKNSKSFSYRLKVRARAGAVWGPFSEAVMINFTRFGQSEEPFVTMSRGVWNSTQLLIVILFVFGLMIMIGALFMCLYCKYATSRKHKKKKMPQKSSVMSIDITNYSQIDLRASATKVYIDPSNYEDPSTILQEFALEIDPRKIQIECVIGEGEFGEVCKGRLYQTGQKHGIRVAIKTLKPNCSEKEKMNFLSEAGIMGQFSHQNVIKLEGVVTNTEPVMILTHYMENGSLDSFLRKKRNQFSLLQLLGMLRGICSGMRYLSDMHYVHRDLAARNILVDSLLCCKVSDFGLSREIISDSTEGAYTTKGGLIPIRWTAPEAINYRRFTSSSDVWSFGVVMWEMMSYGDRPYWNWANKDVLQAIESGYRLPAPRNCPPSVHLLMLDCWTYERSERPKFAQILHCIEAFIRNPEALTSMRQSRSLNRLAPSTQPRSSLQNYNHPNHYVMHSQPQINEPLISSTISEPIFGPDSSVSQWLDCLNLPNYKDNFTSHNLSYLAQITRFTTTDLLALGITQSDHMNKIVSNIRAMQNYFELSSLTQASVL